MFGRNILGVAAAALALTISTIAWPAADSSAAPVTQPAGARLVSVQPCRLADTRSGEGYTRIDPHTIRVRVAGRCGLPSSPVAVALNAVSLNAAARGFLTLYPAGITRPLASNVNNAPKQIRSNAAITKVGVDGSVEVYTTSGDVVLDTSGAFVDDGPVAAGRFVAVTPRRLLDTRQSAIVPPGGDVTVPLPSGVPSDAVALALVITVTESSGAGFVTTYPAGTARPLASILNLDGPGQTRAAGGIHSVSPAGLTIHLSGGGHVVVDQTGWFTGPTAAIDTAGTFLPVDPQRLLDTRQARLIDRTLASVPLAADETIELAPQDTATPGMTMAMNITSVDAEPGYLTAFPAGSARPTTSVLNPMGAGDIVANFGIVPTSNAGLSVYSLRSGHVLVDLAGWFTTSAVSLPPTTTAPTTTTVPPTTAPTTTTTLPPTTTTTTTTTVPPTTTTTTVPPTTTTTTLPPTTTTAPPTTTTTLPPTTTTTTTVPPTTTTTTVPTGTTTTTTVPPTTTTTTVPPTTTTTTLPPTTTTTTTTVPPGNRPIVYLTFDDGPEATMTPQVLDMLARHGVKATFFLVGEHVAAEPALTARILTEGHALGNHSWNHPDLRTLTNAQILQQLNDTTAAIRTATGHTVTCMRPPYGYVDPGDGPAVTPMNANVRSTIATTGLPIILWNRDTNDWATTTTQANIISVLNSMPTTPGGVFNVLMHDWAPNTLPAVDQWLTLHAADYDFRTVPQC